MYTVQTLKYTSFELERFGNDCSAKVIAKNQVKKVINFFFCKLSFASGYHMLVQSDLYEKVGVRQHIHIKNG